MTLPAVDVLVGLVGDDKGRVLVNRRRPGTDMQGFWEFPGGKRRLGEARFDALRRELDEELGITVLAAEPVLVHAHNYPDKRVILDIWHVQKYDGVPLGREQQELYWAAPLDLADLPMLPADAPLIEWLLH